MLPCHLQRLLQLLLLLLLLVGHYSPMPSAPAATCPQRQGLEAGRVLSCIGASDCQATESLVMRRLNTCVCAAPCAFRAL